MWFLAPRESVTWGPLKSDPTGSLLIKSAGIFFLTTNTSNLSPLWFFLFSVNCLKQFQDWIDPFPTREFYARCAPSVQRNIHRGNQLRFKLFKL